MKSSKIFHFVILIIMARPLFAQQFTEISIGIPNIEYISVGFGTGNAELLQKYLK
jgi:hypothetical protein